MLLTQNAQISNVIAPYPKCSSSSSIRSPETKSLGMRPPSPSWPRTLRAAEIVHEFFQLWHIRKDDNGTVRAQIFCASLPLSAIVLRSQPPRPVCAVDRAGVPERLTLARVNDGRSKSHRASMRVKKL